MKLMFGVLCYFLIISFVGGISNLSGKWLVVFQVTRRRRTHNFFVAMVRLMRDVAMYDLEMD